MFWNGFHEKYIYLSRLKSKSQKIKGKKKQRDFIAILQDFLLRISFVSKGTRIGLNLTPKQAVCINKTNVFPGGHVNFDTDKVSINVKQLHK